MEIVELQSLTESQALDVQALIKELVPGLSVSLERLVSIVDALGTHFFAAVGDDGHIVGCATLCVFDTPTGRKARGGCGCESGLSWAAYRTEVDGAHH